MSDWPRWRSEAACREMDPVIFFPESRDEVGAAGPICAACPVREECLDYALANRIDEGTWGGVSERGRRRMRRRPRVA
ncbi:MAG: WhiB family transcriptional regulator [Pseudomonadota bacterium]